jgi:hypothetical protein
MIRVSAEQRREMGARIGTHLRARGAKADLARKMQCTEAYITKICREGPPSLDALVYVSLFLGVPLQEIVWGTGTRLPRSDVAFVSQLKALMDNAPAHLKPSK